MGSINDDNQLIFHLQRECWTANANASRTQENWKAETPVEPVEPVSADLSLSAGISVSVAFVVFLNSYLHINNTETLIFVVTC